MESLARNIVKYEDSQMTEEEVIQFFQKLIDTGVAWKLQGHYGRTANKLIEEGVCKLAPITIDS